MAMIAHKDGKFTTEDGMVERHTEYPDFVYRHRDGRSVRIPIGHRPPRSESVSWFWDVREDGVHRVVSAVGYKGEADKLFPWQ